MPRTRAVIAITSAALLLSGLGTATAHAEAPVTDLYVNSSSSTCNQTGPGTQAIPFCSVQEAADVVDPGQTVHILSSAQPTAPIVISRSGTPDAPVSFVGSGSSPDFTAIAAPSAPNTGQALVSIENAQYVSLSNLRLESHTETAVRSINSQHIELDHVDVIGSDSPLTPVASPADGVDIDGTSSDVVISHSQNQGSAGSAIAAKAGAAHIVLASDALVSVGSAVNADSVDDLEVAGVTILNVGGGVRITGTSTGSVENTVVVPDFRTGTVGNVAVYVSAEASGGVSADYNVVTPFNNGAEYSWGATVYTSTSAFHAATGQGLHDVDNPPGLSATPVEGSPVIDSGDADAPGESSTDYRGQPRVDDLLVANTGTGNGYVDRGGMEYQDRFSASATTTTTGLGDQTYPLAVTTTTSVNNPWSEGATYSYDYGDGTRPTVTRDPSPQQHTYTGPPSDDSGVFTVRVTVQRDSGTSTTFSQRLSVLKDGPLVAEAWQSTLAHPEEAGVVTLYDQSNDPYKITKISTDWGDGSAPTVSAPENLTPGNSEIIRHGYADPGVHTAVQTVIDAAGHSVSNTVQGVAGTAYEAYSSPERILDTRSGLGAAKRKVGPGGVLKLRITGTSADTGTAPTAVTLNVTDADATAASWVTAYPDGSARPTASNLNFQAGQSNPNLVTVPVGADGCVDLYNASGYVDLIADIQGEYDITPSNDGHASTFLPNTPTRILDTRHGIGVAAKPVGPGSTISVPLPSSLVDSGTTAVMVDVTATQPSARSWIAAYAGDGTLPTTSNLNFSVGQTTSNLVIVPVDSSHKIKFYNRAGQTAIIADVLGVFTNEARGTFYVPLAPARLVDTRSGLGTAKKRLGPNSTLQINVSGTHGIPTGATAVTLNLTGTGSTAATYLTAYSSGTVPKTSNINLVPGQTRPVLVTVPIRADGTVLIYNYTGSIDVVADVQGYYAP
ncbi:MULTISPECIES: hypothetical protein [Streptacidiphilus]|uniref:PKD domain-containing protein n=1 Tax=Streptacidiphilus cavernicola TaxID=3342716 RepID=A0ABV6UGP0_9ACTN|nr:hypothetical protein [Streptacidiphilus jeojiense]